MPRCQQRGFAATDGNRHRTAAAAAAAGPDAGAIPPPHLLNFVGVEVQQQVLLRAHKVQRGSGAPAHDADALRHVEHGLQLRDVPRVQLQRFDGGKTSLRDEAAPGLRRTPPSGPVHTPLRLSPSPVPQAPAPARRRMARLAQAEHERDEEDEEGPRFGSAAIRLVPQRGKPGAGASDGLWVPVPSSPRRRRSPPPCRRATPLPAVQRHPARPSRAAMQLVRRARPGMQPCRPMSPGPTSSGFPHSPADKQLRDRSSRLVQHGEAQAQRVQLGAGCRRCLKRLGHRPRSQPPPGLHTAWHGVWRRRQHSRRRRRRRGAPGQRPRACRSKVPRRRSPAASLEGPQLPPRPGRSRPPCEPGFDAMQGEPPPAAPHRQCRARAVSDVLHPSRGTPRASPARPPPSTQRVDGQRCVGAVVEEGKEPDQFGGGGGLGLVGPLPFHAEQAPPQPLRDGHLPRPQRAAPPRVRAQQGLSHRCGSVRGRARERAMEGVMNPGPPRTRPGSRPCLRCSQARVHAGALGRRRSSQLALSPTARAPASGEIPPSPPLPSPPKKQEHHKPMHGPMGAKDERYVIHMMD